MLGKYVLVSLEIELFRCSIRMLLRLPPLFAQLSKVTHVRSESQCISALLDMLHLRAATDAVHTPPPALHTRLQKQTVCCWGHYIVHACHNSIVLPPLLALPLLVANLLPLPVPVNDGHSRYCAGTQAFKRVRAALCSTS